VTPPQPLSLPALRDLLDRFDVTLKKSLGQNFLHEAAWLARVAAAGQVGPRDVVLEIGPGAGSLTQYLAQQARHVVAVELDARLLPLLQYTLADYGNVSLVHGDILELAVADLLAAHFPELPAAPGAQQLAHYKVVANIPYYNTAAILRHLLAAPVRPAQMVLTVQAEVAARLTASPGALSLLAVSVQLYGQPRVVGRVPAGAFFPRPQVDSAIVCLDLYPQALVPEALLDGFFRVVRAGFGQKRKQLHNALAHGLHLPRATVAAALQAAGIDPRRRAETLALEEWGRLAAALQAAGTGQVGTKKGCQRD